MSGDTPAVNAVESEVARQLAAAVEHAERVYATRLDYTPASIADVELILGRMSEMIPCSRWQKLFGRRPAPEQIAAVALMYGIYLGEVLRRSLGGEWRMETVEEKKTIGLRLPAGFIVYPASQTYRRLLNGAEANIENFFREICSRAAKPVTPPEQI